VKVHVPHVFSLYYSRDVIWFRVFDHGLWVGCTPMLFSERYGYVKRLHLWNNWRIGWLLPHEGLMK